MILIWNDVHSFERHLEDMRLFRRSHNDIPPVVELKFFKDMPIPFDIEPPRETGIIKSFTDSRGKLILVPIWETTLPRGSQN
jgi:hypothetical protein